MAPSPFESKPLNPTKLQLAIRKYPAAFGIPFVLIVVGASFLLTPFTQTRYDLHDERVKQMTKEQQLGLEKNKKKFDIREEYYRLSAKGDEDWEPKRIQRPKGEEDP